MPSQWVVVVFWLLSGHPAYDYMPADKCRAVQAMTIMSGSVELELADGSRLTATKVDCIKLAASLEATQ